MFTCKILSYNAINNQYELLFPGEKQSRIYHKNVGRNIFIGRNSTDRNNIDAYYYSNETGTTIDLDKVTYFLSKGYINVDLRNCADKNEYLHRMVAYSWVPGYNSKKDDVDHISGDKEDNRPENLEPAPPFANSCKEFKRNNPKAREYMTKAINDERRMADYSDLISSARFMLKKEDCLVVNKFSKNLTEEDISSLIYILEKLGYDVKKKGETDDDDKTPIGVK
jgi:hypothetical protein